MSILFAKTKIIFSGKYGGDDGRRYLGFTIGTGVPLGFFPYPCYSCIAVFRNVYLFMYKSYDFATYRCISCLKAEVLGVAKPHHAYFCRLFAYIECLIVFNAFFKYYFSKS